MLVLPIVLAITLPAFSQPSYYESRARQTAEYKSLSSATTRAYSVSDSRTYSSSTSSSSSSGSSGSTSASSRSSSPVIINNTDRGYSNIGADDRMKRMAAAAARQEQSAREQAAIINNAEGSYRSLIAGMGIAKTAEDHYDLLLVGLRNGIDLRGVHRVIGKDLAQYKTIWGNHPDKPFYPSDGRMQYAEHAIKVLSDPNFTGDRANFLRDIAKAIPTPDNHRRAGDAALVEYQYDNAIWHFKQVLKEKSHDAEAIAGLAAAQSLEGYYPQAEETFMRIANDNVNADVFTNLARVQLLNGKQVEALKSATAAAELDPIHAGYKLLQAALDKNTAAVNTFSAEATKLMPSLGNGSLISKFIAMARFLHKEGAYQESLIYLDIALPLDPKNLDLLELRYGTNMKIRRDAEALKDEQTINKL